MQKPKDHSQRALVKARITNWPVLVLSALTLAILGFYFDADALRAAIKPGVVKPLMAVASAISLLCYFLIGRDALKFLLALHVLASVAILLDFAIQRVSLIDFAFEFARRAVVITVVTCLYFWSRDREISLLQRGEPGNGEGQEE